MHARQQKEQGFTILEALIGIAILAVVVAGLSLGFRGYVASTQLLAMSAKVAEIEPYIPTLLWQKVNAYLNTVGGACSLNNLLTSSGLDGARLGTYGKLQAGMPVRPLVYTPVAGSQAEAALATCQTPWFPADAAVGERTFFCMQLLSNGGVSSESFFGNTEAFMQVAISFRSLTTGQAISCTAFSSRLPDPGVVAVIATSIFWHKHVSRQLVAGLANEKRRDLIFYATPRLSILPAGFFWVQNTGGFSDGLGHYCSYPDLATFMTAGGTLSSYRFRVIPPTEVYDGPCP